jgi:alpha-N-arabinofuranosidase
MKAEDAEKKAHFYDKRDRHGMKVFVGEWATREGFPTTNLNAGLADAAFMTGMERNSDIVIMSCYAPLFVNVNRGGMQWKSDLIGYNAMESYGCPSYYVQEMFGNYLGDVLPESSITGVPLSSKGIEQVYYSVTRDSAKGTLYLKLVNVGGTARPVEIKIKGAGSIGSEATQVVLSSADPQDTNAITSPTKIAPVMSRVRGIGTEFTQTLPAYSVTVLEIESK